MEKIMSKLTWPLPLTKKTSADWEGFQRYFSGFRDYEFVRTSVVVTRKKQSHSGVIEYMFHAPCGDKFEIRAGNIFGRVSYEFAIPDTPLLTRQAKSCQIDSKLIEMNIIRGSINKNYTAQPRHIAARKLRMKHSTHGNHIRSPALRADLLSTNVPAEIVFFYHPINSKPDH